MLRTNLFLLFFVMCCALGVVTSQHKARKLFQALEAEQRKLASGKSTSFVVLQLQRNLTQARKAEIQARADYNLQRSSLALAEGTMLQRHQVELAAE